MSDIIKELDLNQIYNELQLHSKGFAISALLIIIYLDQNNIPFEKYITINESSAVYIRVENDQEGTILNTANNIVGEDILKIRNTVYFPNFFIQGYLMSNYFMGCLNDRKQLKSYMTKYQMKNSEGVKTAFGNLCAGVVHYFSIKFDIKELHQYLHIITVRENTNIKNPDRPYMFDIISVWLLLTYDKNSVWNINREQMSAVMKMLKVTYFSWKSNPVGKLDKVNVESIFNCKFAEIVNWWRAAYLGNENRGEAINPLDTPPKRSIKFKDLFEFDTTESLLANSFNLIIDHQKKKEIKDVYLSHCTKESHNNLVYGKINSFIKYLNYCLEKSITYTDTTSIKTYIKEKYIGKNIKSKNEVINNLRGYFNIAITAGYYKELRSNPVTYLLNGKQSKFSKIPDDKVISEKEMKQIFAIQDQMSKFERLFIRLLYYTGLRIGEALLLTVGCVVQITETAVLLVVPPFKQRKKPFTILIEELEVIGVIKELIKERTSFGNIPHSTTGEAKLWLLVETTEEGRGLQHITKKRGNQIIEKACKLAGIKRYTNHCLRHSFAHRKLYDEKYDPESVSTLMGHACPDTLIIYSKLTNQEKLKYFSIMLRRRRSTQEVRKNFNTAIIKTPNDEYQVCLSNCHNRWCGNGWCTTEGSVKCPKRYISHYTCLLFKPDPTRKIEMVDDFYANLLLLENELLKEIPIVKDVNLFENIIDAIIVHLKSIGFNTTKIETEGTLIRKEARNTVDKERVR
jgi:site-specific recombinase XerD